MKTRAAVTGSFSYSGKYITRRLLDAGQEVITLTGHPERPNPFGGKVKAYPFNFDHPEALVDTLDGVDTLYNTYWVRFNHGDNSHDLAVSNTRKLIQAAESAGVRRIVHISITNPDLNSPLPYFHGKAMLEEMVQGSSLSYAILRPTVIFGVEDILINNIAWMLRRYPFFVIPGAGDYRLQPIYAEDLAALAVQAGKEEDNTIIDAVGPEIYSFGALVCLLADTVSSCARIVKLPPKIALLLSRLVGIFVGDVVLTQEEVDGLMANLLISDAPPTGGTSLKGWLSEHADVVG
ncbi:MAG: NAD(P)H-binding protein, partial [Chloroflexota bacterium]